GFAYPSGDYHAVAVFSKGGTTGPGLRIESEDAQHTPGRDFPYPHVGIVTRRNQTLAVCTESDGTHLASMAFEIPNKHPTGCVPQLDGMIAAGSSDHPPIRTEHHGMDKSGVND